MNNRQYIKLSQLCVITMGQSPSSDTYNTSKNGLPFYQGNADFGDLYPHNRIWCSAPKKIAHRNDLLISVRAPIGAVNIATETCCIGRGLAALAPNENCSLNYLFYAVKNLTNELEHLGTGSTFKAINKDILENIPVPYYDKLKQELISQRLSLVDRTIFQRKSQLKLFDELIKSRFVEMFGIPYEKSAKFEKDYLKNSCQVITGNTPSKADSNYYGHYIEWIKTDNILSNEIYPTTATQFLSKEGLSVGRSVKGNSVLMACIAGSISSIGKVCITDREVAFNQQINAIVPHKYNVFFLYVMLLLSKDYLISDLHMALKGIITKSMLENKIFIIPPIKLQNQFAEFVQQVDKSRLAVQKSLDELEILKKSLMQEYFS